MAKVELGTLTLRPAVRACYLCPALLVFRIKNCLHTLGSGLHHCQSVFLRKEGSSNPAVPDRNQSTAGRDHPLGSVSEDPSNLGRLKSNSSVYIYIPPPLDEGHLNCSLPLRCILPPPSGLSRPAQCSLAAILTSQAVVHTELHVHRPAIPQPAAIDEWCVCGVARHDE